MAVCRERVAEAIVSAADDLRSLEVGASAVGTGVNTFPGYCESVVNNLRRMTGRALHPHLSNGTEANLPPRPP